VHAVRGSHIQRGAASVRSAPGVRDGVPDERPAVRRRARSRLGGGDGDSRARRLSADARVGHQAGQPLPAAAQDPDHDSQGRARARRQSAGAGPQEAHAGARRSGAGRRDELVMRPAFSVIFLTTLIGAGPGLFLALYCTEIAGARRLIPMPDGRSFFAAGSLISLVLSGLGLFASFLHLGHPERAWRAAAMWRTSWLSREVIVLPAFMGAVFVYAAGHYAGSGVVTLVAGA